MSALAIARARLGDWLDLRTGWRSVASRWLDEPIPGGARWAYVLGSGLLLVLVNQAVTGVFLSLYYVPSADHAHTTVSFIQKQVTDGAFIRSLHSHGSSLMVVILLLHLGQTFVYGAYKSSRELLWLCGCLLFLLVLGMGFTGYLLRWDQRAYAATAVATNILSEVPIVGDGLKRFLRGGTEMGTLTISRFFSFHVFAIPALIVAGVGAHVLLFRRSGPAGPPVPDAERSRLSTQPFFPGQVLKDFSFGLALGVGLAAAAWWRPVTLGPLANPADSTYLPRPEWYLRPAFQWLKYWHGPASVVGIVLIPSLLFLAMFAVPFIDRSPERRPWRRPISVGSLFLVFGALVWLGARSSSEDQSDPEVRSRLMAQEAAERRFAGAPFEPEEAGVAGAGSRATSARALGRLEAKGARLFDSESCSGCHGPAGVGGAGLFRLPALDRAFPGDQLKTLLERPNAAMVEGGMEPVSLAGEDLESLLAYLRLVTADPER